MYYSDILNLTFLIINNCQFTISYHILLIFMMKRFCCFTSLPSFPKIFSRLPAFTSCLNTLSQKLTKNIYSCEIIWKNMKLFTKKNKLYDIWYILIVQSPIFDDCFIKRVFSITIVDDFETVNWKLKFVFDLISF